MYLKLTGTVVLLTVLFRLGQFQGCVEDGQELKSQVAALQEKLYLWQNAGQTFCLLSQGNAGCSDLKEEILILQEEVSDLKNRTSECSCGAEVLALRRELQLALLGFRTQESSKLGERWSNPAKSCDEIGELKPDSLPGKFWIENPLGSPVLVECAAAASSPSLVSVRVAYVNMTDPSHQCPGQLTEFTYSDIYISKRLCARRQSRAGCESATFTTYGLPYSTVYGRIRSYQYGSPSGFYTPYLSGNDVDSTYLEGVSITHGSSPRKHIWSFANALYENTGFDNNVHICPCTNPASTMPIPSFVGTDYFCDSGAQDSLGVVGRLYDDPLWDGSGCGLASTCCQFNNPPFFRKDLPQTTTDDIEVRLCADQVRYDEDSPIELIELYIR